MAKPKLWKLNPMDFTKLTPARQEKIAQAPAKPMPSPQSYKPNQIASALHPKAQYLRVAKIVERGADVKSYYLEPDPQRGTGSLAYWPGLQPNSRQKALV